VSTALKTARLGKRYGRTWALRDCRIELPQGRVAALVGPNGAGKTTLLHLAIGLLRPDAGDVEVLGRKPFDNPRLLNEVGFVAQQTPLYPDFTATELIKMGAKLNRRWDPRLPAERLARLGIAQNRPVRQLSGGQRAQVALALALAKRVPASSRQPAGAGAARTTTARRGSGRKTWELSWSTATQAPGTCRRLAGPGPRAMTARPRPEWTGSRSRRVG